MKPGPLLLGGPPGINVEQQGIEPWASCLQGRRSIRLSYNPMCLVVEWERWDSNPRT